MGYGKGMKSIDCENTMQRGEGLHFMKRPPVQVGSPRECESENLGHSPGVGLTCGRSNHPLVNIIFRSYSNTFQPLMIPFATPEVRTNEHAAAGTFSVLDTMHTAHALPKAKYTHSCFH